MTKTTLFMLQPRKLFDTGITSARLNIMKRSISNILDGNDGSAVPATRRKLSPGVPDGSLSDAQSSPSPLPPIPKAAPIPTHRLALPSVKAPSQVPKAPPFQIPTQLVAFSYTPAREQVFTNEALKYFVEPPHGADLAYGYERWVKRPEEKGRLDGLLKALLKEEARLEFRRAGVVSWRGVMTK